MSDFARWLQDLVSRVFYAAFGFLGDVFIFLVDMVLHAVLVLFSLLSFPFENISLQAALDMLPPGVWFFIGHFQLPACFAALGLAVSFRLARKVITFFQW